MRPRFTRRVAESDRELLQESIKKVIVPTAPEGTLKFYMQTYHQWMREMNYSEHTIKNHRCFFGKFVAWCEERGILKPEDISQQLIERYQKILYQSRESKTEEVLTLNSQRVIAMAIHSFFRWMRKRGYLAQNPAADIDIPRTEYRLPQIALTTDQVEKILSATDTEDLIGIRDRAILEVLYSSGIRRAEVSNLKIYDIDSRQGTLMIRQGKGKRDRVVPIGARAIAWVEKYVSEVRPALAADPDHGHLFVMKRNGGPMSPKWIGYVTKEYMEKAEITKKGSCHQFRHAMATHLLENGADVKIIQQMLGHQHVGSTEVYANLTITKLKEKHTELHPAKMPKPLPKPKTK